MQLTEHARQRAAQRGFSDDEILLLTAMGLQVAQKGKTSLFTIAERERGRWTKALKEVMAILRQANDLPRKVVKQKTKTIKRLIDKLSAKHLPYLVLSDENERVITCGHYYQRKIKRA